MLSSRGQEQNVSLSGDEQNLYVFHINLQRSNCSEIEISVT